MRQTEYDIVVIGGGHAGAEAAWAACNMLPPETSSATSGAGAGTGGGGASGGRVALVTMDPAKVGAMSCNPAIGGLAKGQMVREIDALGGLMGLAADATGIQFRVLNRSKGPAVHGPRCQNDKYAYAAEVQRLLGTRDNLDILRGTVDDLLVEDGRCVGVFCRGWEGDDGPACVTDACCGEFGAVSQVEKSFTLRANAVVLTTGTFMRALMHAGSQQTPGGRIGEGSAVGISAALKKLGFDLGRLKTGTPPRLARESLDLDSLEQQPGDAAPLPFSEMSGIGPRPAHGDASALDHSAYERVMDRFPVAPQVHCWVTHTCEASHELIRANLHRAPMYNGQIAAGNVGPRYCPSIEDKVVRFADRPSHHVYLEPESLSTNEVYCNGISTSLPPEVQLQIVRAMPGCERAVILKPGYAVEYDMVWPHQIDATCMTKRLPGLFLAGQINGTSGYEEAAGQGLIAGVNAVRWSRAVEQTLRSPPGSSLAQRRRGPGEFYQPFRLGRNEAYLGVMMDDLVTKVPREPYRMFTSRAEHRLMLRSDNADARLTPLGRELGTVDDARWEVFQHKQQIKSELSRLVDQAKVEGVPAMRWIAVAQPDAVRVAAQLDIPREHHHALRAVLAERQYAGYIERSKRELERLAEREHTPLPSGLDFADVKGLRAEAANVLSKFRPATLGQAGRLAGVNPADLMLVSVALGR